MYAPSSLANAMTNSGIESGILLFQRSSLLDVTVSDKPERPCI
jgi:hypothetical protein